MISLVVAPLFESIKEFLSKLNNEYQAIKIDEQIVLPTCLLAKHTLIALLGIALASLPDKVLN